MEKFDLLVKVLSDLQDAGILKHLVLVGSWCQDFYRYQFGNPPQIPATKTMDADILIPRRMPKVNPPVDIVSIMKNKAEKDRLTAEGMFLFIQTDAKRVQRLHQIIGEQSKGWQKTIRKALVNTGMELPK